MGQPHRAPLSLLPDVVSVVQEHLLVCVGQRVRFGLAHAGRAGAVGAGAAWLQDGGADAGRSLRRHRRGGGYGRGACVVRGHRPADSAGVALVHCALPGPRARAGLLSPLHSRQREEQAGPPRVPLPPPGLCPLRVVAAVPLPAQEALAAAHRRRGARRSRRRGGCRRAAASSRSAEAGKALAGTRHVVPQQAPAAGAGFDRVSRGKAAARSRSPLAGLADVRAAGGACP
mmetsp:Transcript_5797/g.24432  ORF Transcript_5797/g.24432 Transcript_5797/m.24432 type:complete len:230 (+) Transcript_5797:934-1623(+)